MLLDVFFTSPNLHSYTLCQLITWKTVPIVTMNLTFSGGRGLNLSGFQTFSSSSSTPSSSSSSSFLNTCKRASLKGRNNKVYPSSPRKEVQMCVTFPAISTVSRWLKKKKKNGRTARYYTSLLYRRDQWARKVSIFSWFVQKRSWENGRLGLLQR